MMSSFVSIGQTPPRLPFFLMIVSLASAMVVGAGAGGRSSSLDLLERAVRELPIFSIPADDGGELSLEVVSNGQMYNDTVARYAPSLY